MNEHNQWRIVLAGQIAPIYAAQEAVLAVVLAGGVARGRGDAYSDIDLVVFWCDRVGEGERADCLRQVIDRLPQPVTVDPPHTITAFDAPGDDGLLWEDALHLPGGLKIDIGHRTAQAMNRILDDVTLHGDINGHKHEVLYSIRRVQVFHGEPLVCQWQERAAYYPDALLWRLIDTHTARLQPNLAMHRHRGDWLLFYNTLVSAQHDLIGLLFALNRVYRPDDKRLADLCAELPLKPDRLYDRLSAMFTGDPAAAESELDTLAEEVFALIEQQVPSADLTIIRLRFYQRRPPVTPG